MRQTAYIRRGGWSRFSTNRKLGCDTESVSQFSETCLRADAQMVPPPICKLKRYV